MSTIGVWVIGALACLIAIGALFVASGAGSGALYLGGLAVFAACVLFVMWLIKRNT